MARLLGWEWQVKKCLGVKSKMDPDFCADGYVNGVSIHIYTSETAKQDGVFHRVYACCPECHKEVSAGRLNQHWNKLHKDKSWPTFYWDYQNNQMTNRDPYLTDVPGASKSFTVTAIGQ